MTQHAERDTSDSQDRPRRLLMEDLRILEDRLASAEATAQDFARALRRIAGPRNSDPSTIRRTVARAALRAHPEYSDGMRLDDA